MAHPWREVKVQRARLISPTSLCVCAYIQHMGLSAPPPPDRDALLDQAVAKSFGQRNRRRFTPPQTTPEAPTTETTRDWAEIAKRVAPLLLPWVFARRFVAALRWVHVDTLSIDGKDEEALRLLRRLPADMQAWSNWRLKELQLLSLLQWNQEALDKANAFLLGRALSKTTDENSRYFTCFAQWLGQRAFLDLTEEGPIPSLLVYDVASIDLTKVKDRWKRQFPLRVHPEWRDD